jgi:hypothetical protein
MAIAVENLSIGNNIVSDGGATTIAFTTNQIVAAGSFIVVCIGWFTSVTLSSVAGGGLSWLIDKQGSGGDASDGNAIVSAQAPAGLASGVTITATLSGATSPARAIGGSSFTGIATSSPVDVTAGPTQVSTAAWSTGNMAIVAGSLIVAVDFNEGTNSGNTPTAPSAELWERTHADGFECVAEYRIESSAGSYAVAGTFGAATKNNNVGVAYLAAAGAVDEDPLIFRRRRSRMTSW